MGYGYYEIGGMERGYSVSDHCGHPDCNALIDRGLSYLCYCCTHYFCEKHLTMAFDANDEPIEAMCFAGNSGQVCSACAEEMEKEGTDHGEC